MAGGSNHLAAVIGSAGMAQEPARRGPVLEPHEKAFAEGVLRARPGCFAAVANMLQCSEQRVRASLDPAWPLSQAGAGGRARVETAPGESRPAASARAASPVCVADWTCFDDKARARLVLASWHGARILAHLIRHAPRAFTAADLAEVLWPGCGRRGDTAKPAGVRVHVHALRQCLRGAGFGPEVLGQARDASSGVTTYGLTRAAAERVAAFVAGGRAHG